MIVTVQAMEEGGKSIHSPIQTTKVPSNSSQGTLFEIISEENT